MEPIRVLQIIGSVESGGVEAVIMNYYRNIDRTRVQFDFVVHKNGRRSYIDAIKQMGARVYEVTPYSQNLFAFMSEVYKIVKENSYKIVHCNMNAMSVFPLLAAKLGGGTCVFCTTIPRTRGRSLCARSLSACCVPSVPCLPIDTGLARGWRRCGCTARRRCRTVECA